MSKVICSGEKHSDTFVMASFCKINDQESQRSEVMMAKLARLPSQSILPPESSSPYEETSEALRLPWARWG